MFAASGALRCRRPRARTSPARPRSDDARALLVRCPGAAEQGSRHQRKPRHKGPAGGRNAQAPNTRCAMVEGERQVPGSAAGTFSPDRHDGPAREKRHDAQEHGERPLAPASVRRDRSLEERGVRDEHARRVSWDMADPHQRVDIHRRRRAGHDGPGGQAREQASSHGIETWPDRLEDQEGTAFRPCEASRSGRSLLLLHERARGSAPVLRAALRRCRSKEQGAAEEQDREDQEEDRGGHLDRDVAHARDGSEIRACPPRPRWGPRQRDPFGAHLDAGLKRFRMNSMLARTLAKKVRVSGSLSGTKNSPRGFVLQATA